MSKEPADKLAVIQIHGKTKQVCKRSLFLFSVQSNPRKFVLSIVEWRWFDYFILFCIAINSVLLVIYQHRGGPDDSINWFIDKIADVILTIIFTVECVLKVIAWGFIMEKKSYLRDPWNVLDFIVVSSGIIGWIPGADRVSAFRPLRLFRVLRPLRSLNAIPQMKSLVNTVISSVPKLGNVAILGAFLFLVFGIIGITLMGGIFYRACRTTKDPVLLPLLDGQLCWSWNLTDGAERLCGGRFNCEGTGGFCGGHADDLEESLRPLFSGRSRADGGMQDAPWCDGSEPKKLYPFTDFVHFDHIGGALLLIFQCMTLEGWTDLMYIVQDGFNNFGSWIFFFLMVVITSFFVLNVALAVVDEAREAFEDPEEEGGDDASQTGSLLSMDTPSLNGDQEYWLNKAPVRFCFAVGQNEFFINFIMLIIAGNVVTMMLETYPPQVILDEALRVLGLIFLSVFVLEMVIMLIALGPRGYVTNPVTCFDGFVVLISLVELITGGGGGLRALRTLRLFRVLNKLAARFPSIKVLLLAIVHTGKALGYWLVLFVLVLFIFTLTCIHFFNNEFHFQEPVDDLVGVLEQGEPWCPGTEGLSWHFRQDCIPRAHFDTFAWGFVTVFQVMTGENWNTIMYAGLRAKGWGFFVLFVVLILFGQTLFLSLFLSMLMSKFDHIQDELETKHSKSVMKRQKSMRGPLKSGFISAISSLKGGPAKEQPHQPLADIPNPSPSNSAEEVKGDDDRSVSLEDLPGQLPEPPRPEEEINVSLTSSMRKQQVVFDEDEEAGMESSPAEIPSNKWPHGYAWFLLSETNPIRVGARRILDHQVEFQGTNWNVFDNFILVCILLSTLCMAIDNPLRDPDDAFTVIIRTADAIFAIVFIIEMVVKFLAWGFICGDDAYLKSGWNWLDGIVVAVSITGFITPDGPAFLKTLRILRAFRPLRVISRNENLKVVVQTIFAALPDLASLVLIFFIFLLIFALMAMMYLAGQFYECTGDGVKFMRDFGTEAETITASDFRTPLCLGIDLLPTWSQASGAWQGGGTWSAGTCGPSQLQWERASADTPICLARCDPFENPSKAPSSLCPRKYEIPEELPSMCDSASGRYLAEEEIGNAYVEAMQRTLVLPCGGSAINKASGHVDSTAAASMSCRAHFCPGEVAADVRDRCEWKCQKHPHFCSDICAEDGNSAQCSSCRRECEAWCHCEDYCTPMVKDAALCYEQGGSWTASLPQNFNNVFNALMTLVEISTTEGWVDVMYAACDSVAPYVQPKRDTNMIWAPFFVLWIFSSFMFLINLSVGVIVDKFMDLKEQGKTVMLTQAQLKWVNSRKTLHGQALFFDITNLQDLKPWRRKAYDLVNHKTFDHFIMAAILLNSLTMAMKTFPAPTAWWDPFLEGLNYLFAIIYTVEAALKLYALRRSYWKDNWNCFDFVCVFATAAGFILNHVAQINVGSAASVIRIFRIARLFRLLRFLKGLNRLFSALVISLPKLANVVLILLLLLVLFSILGVSLFSTVKHNEYLNYYGNFQDFYWAFTTLFRASTGEAWNSIMHDLGMDEADWFHMGPGRDNWCTPAHLYDWSSKYQVLKDKCLIQKPNMCVQTFWDSNPLPFIFWVVYTLLISLMVMNLVIAVILEGYGDCKTNEEDEVIQKCIYHWKRFDPDQRMSVHLPMAIQFINLVVKDVNPSEDLPSTLRTSATTISAAAKGDWSIIPLKLAKAYNLSVNHENKVSFLNASLQVLRFTVLKDDMADDDGIKAIEDCDNKMGSKELAKLRKLERKATKFQLAGTDLIAEVAARKIQRLWKAFIQRKKKAEFDRNQKGGGPPAGGTPVAFDEIPPEVQERLEPVVAG